MNIPREKKKHNHSLYLWQHYLYLHLYLKCISGTSKTTKHMGIKDWLDNCLPFFWCFLGLQPSSAFQLWARSPWWLRAPLRGPFENRTSWRLSDALLAHPPRNVMAWGPTCLLIRLYRAVPFLQACCFAGLDDSWRAANERFWAWVYQVQVKLSQGWCNQFTHDVYI